MTEARRPQGTVQIALRISPDLRERVKAAAEANNRSVNSELTAALEEKYPPPLTPGLGKLAKAVAAAVVDAAKKGGGDQGIEDAAKNAMLAWLNDPETSDEDRNVFQLSYLGP